MKRDGHVCIVETCPTCGRILIEVLGRDFCLLCDRPQTYEEQLAIMEQRVLGK